MSVTELQSRFSSTEISEWMAYDLTKDPKWSKSYEMERERIASKAMDDEERLEAFKRLLGPK